MLEKVKELINRPHCYTINFKYESYGPMIVTCTINRPYIKHLAIQSVGSTDEGALNIALNLLEKVKLMDEDKLIECPSLDEQKSIDGYYRKEIGDQEIEFKRTETSYVITNLRQKKDEQGFYSVEPHPLSENFFKVEDSTIPLKEGEALYGWNNIRFLSGTSGLAVVKNGMITKRKLLAMA